VLVRRPQRPDEVGDPAIRLKAFLDPFADHAAFSSICEQDLSSAMLQIGTW